jgi:hypothetical protein
MTRLTELQSAIKQLESDKNNLLKKIQDNCWKEDRHKNKFIPQKTTTAFQGFNVVTPEKRLLPSGISSLYQQWYSAAKTILDKNQLSRTPEFENTYSPNKTKGDLGIKQLIAKRYITKAEQFKLMDSIDAQFDILAAVLIHLKFLIYDVELTVYSVLMDDELIAANHLLKNGFMRPAGALAGVILERHLKNLLRKHMPPIKYKEKDTLAVLNGLCKETIYDLVTWRKVQCLADIRNLCDHDKEREPTKDEVAELINGVSAMLKTINE